MGNVKKRDSNIELLRIYAMFFITMGHICCTSPKAGASPVAFEWFLSLFGIGTVDIFILITGFFMINKTEISLRKFVTVYVEVLFYNLVIVGALVAAGVASVRELFAAALPLGPSKFNLWFVSQYLCLMLLQPFLSRFARMLNHRQYLGFLLMLCCLTATLTPIFPLGYIYSSPWKITWFITLFFTGGYLRLYIPRFGSWVKPALIYVALATIGFAFGQLNAHRLLDGWDLGAYNSLVVFAIAIGAMLLAADMKIGSLPVINWIASSTFAVYIIHQNPYVIDWLMANVPACFAPSTSVYIHSLIGFGVTAMVFMVCVVIDKGRIALFKLCRVDRLEEIVADRLLALIIRTTDRLTRRPA